MLLELIDDHARMDGRFQRLICSHSVLRDWSNRDRSHLHLQSDDRLPEPAENIFVVAVITTGMALC